MYYYWGPYSFIPWHNDGHVSNAGTLYINKDWEKDWGGAYLYECNEGIKVLYPKNNRMVLQNNHTPHSTSIVSKNAPVRITIQIFFN